MIINQPSECLAVEFGCCYAHESTLTHHLETFAVTSDCPPGVGEDQGGSVVGVLLKSYHCSTGW